MTTTLEDTYLTFETGLPRYTEDEILANRAAWSEALRSGEYEQATGGLSVTNVQYDSEGTYSEDIGYCCLGVACEVGKKLGVIDEYDRKQGYPPFEIAAWLGILDSFDETDENEGRTGTMVEYPVYDFETNAERIETKRVSLVELNDAHGFTFADIADVVDAGQVEIAPFSLVTP